MEKGSNLQLELDIYQAECEHGIQVGSTLSIWNSSMSQQPELYEVDIILDIYVNKKSTEQLVKLKFPGEISKLLVDFPVDRNKLVTALLSESKANSVEIWTSQSAGMSIIQINRRLLADL